MSPKYLLKFPVLAIFYYYLVFAFQRYINNIMFFVDVMLINVGYDLLGTQHGHQNPIIVFVPATLPIHQTI